MQLLLYTPQNSPRLQYIVETLCHAAGIQEYQLTDDIDSYRASSLPKINYSAKPISETECQIIPVNLLFETDIKPQPIECFDWLGQKAFFKTDEGDVPFDLLAAAFYLVSRYEEYLPHQEDEYGRYAHINSTAFKNDFLKVPLVNLWVQQLCKILLQKFPALQLNPPKPAFVPTYDIDIAWSYFAKGFLRNLGGLIKSLLKRKTNLALERLEVLLGFEEDPFDVYEWLDNLHRTHALHPVYFFLCAQKTGRYDKNIPPSNKYFQMLQRKLSVMYKTGIHPSWQSGDKPALLGSEIRSLERISGKKITRSRQHYIRMTLPETYNLLIKEGITDDYSIGYGSINGYRASYCMPYQWYNLASEEATALTLHPFCYMEANSLFEQKMTAEEALVEIEHYYKSTREVNGTFITIFHNHLLTTQPWQVEWREMYERFLKEVM